MKYNEAFAIGSECEGIIKCTFARLYDKSGRTLFSLQRVKAETSLEITKDDAGDMYVIGKTKDGADITAWMPGVLSEYEGFETTGTINFDLPLVVAVGESTAKKVPAYLTDKAVEILTDSLSKTKKVFKFTVYKIWDKAAEANLKNQRQVYKVYYARDEKSGLRQLEVYEKMVKPGEYHFEAEYEYVLTPVYQSLIQIIESGAPVYIKPSQFDWHPTDLNNVTIETEGENGEKETVNLNEAIEAAKKKMDTAKMALIAAGVSNFV